MTSSDQPDGITTCHHEANFRHRTTRLKFSRKEVALVLVDLWDTGFGPEPLTHLGWEAEYNLGKSFCYRAAEIELTRILPLLESCRSNGVAVVHCPSADIAVKHPQWNQHATDATGILLQAPAHRPPLAGRHPNGHPTGEKHTPTSYIRGSGSPTIMRTYVQTRIFPNRSDLWTVILSSPPGI